MNTTLIQIQRIQSIPELLDHLPHLTAVYQACFADPPYEEHFTPDKVEEIWTDFIRFNGLVYVAYVGVALVGFSAGHGLIFNPSIVQILHDQAAEVDGAPIDYQRTFYMAELGVRHDFRGQDIGERLVDVRLAEIDPNQYDWVLMRTSVQSVKSANLYKKRGFEEVSGTRMEIIMPRTDGSVRTDIRYFLIRRLKPDLQEERLI